MPEASMKAVVMLRLYVCRALVHSCCAGHGMHGLKSDGVWSGWVGQCTHPCCWHEQEGVRIRVDLSAADISGRGVERA
jgi:hypothetical protein